jgi:peroxiredoxin Q/BCP
MIQEGQPFPDFSLTDQDGNLVTLSDLKGQKAVVYFYPKDDTSGCTAEACEFNEAIPTVPEARVIGISPDGTKSHRKFADKYGLGFTLLSDPDKVLLEPLGLWIEKSMYGRKYMGVDRTTFVLDEEGIVRRIYRKVKPQGHARAVLAELT